MEFRRRLGDQAGRQRVMQSGGHLLLVLHAPPGADPDVREGQIYWRDPTGKWTPSGASPSQPGVGELLTAYEKALDAMQAAEDAAKTARDYFDLLNRLNPMVRTARNLHQTLQDAREAEPADRQVLLWRDRAYAISRSAELLHNDAKNALDFAVAQRAEEEAVSSRRVAAAAHRLNILAAFFFPLATLAALFGINVRSGLEPWDEKYAPLPMLGILGVGLMLGFVLTLFITRKP
jgi:Mg2+ and Co2+ transporter CorA